MNDVFSRHQQLGDVREQAPDPLLAQGALAVAQARFEHAQRIMKTEPPRFALEAAYEAIQETIEAILYSRGYKSYSHEATIAYLHELGFTPAEVSEIDRLRKIRNGSKYYGENVTIEQAKHTVEIATKAIPRITKKVRR